MRLPSRLCALLLAEALAVPGLSAQPPRATFDELWQWEQGVRNAANALKADPAPARAQLDSAVASLERLITWCRSSVARRARNENGQPLLVWQEGDILLDLVGLHARRGDATAAIDAVRRAGAFLAGPDSPIAAGVADDGLFTTLADVVVEDRSSALWRDVPEGVRVLDSLRVRDAARQLRALPFSLAYADTLPLADRIAGLSYLWSEAKYNFVHFDLVPSLDWSAAYREALPRVVAAPRTIDYYRVLQAFLARLHDGHTDVQLPSPLVAHHAIRPRLLTERIEGRVVVRLVGHARMDSL
nr:hypothetical protein [Gemmatimonadaceae bacterium]